MTATVHKLRPTLSDVQAEARRIVREHESRQIGWQIAGLQARRQTLISAAEGLIDEANRIALQIEATRLFL